MAGMEAVCFLCLERKIHSFLQLGRATVNVGERATYMGKGSCCIRHSLKDSSLSFVQGDHAMVDNSLGSREG